MISSAGCDFHPLRILHLVASIGLQSGGSGQVAVGFMHEQHLLGHCPGIWTIDPRSITADLAQKDRMNLSELNTFHAWWPSRVGYSPSMEQAAMAAKGKCYDVLHQHSIWLAISRVTNRWRTAFSRPTVVAPHGTLEEYTIKISRLKKKLALIAYEMANLRNAACLHATSSHEAMSFRRFGLKNPIAVIPNGVPEESLRNKGDSARFRAKFSIPSKSRLLFFLSRLHPQKGLPLLFEAIAQLLPSLSEWFLIIAGFEDKPGYQQELKRLAVKLGIVEKIIFVGPLFGQDKQDASAAADLFVLPTHSENFGIVIAEALAAGVPVLTTRGTPWEELQTHKCGWWVDVSVEAIRDALLDVIHRPRQELAEMGQRGKQLVAAKYTWPEVTKRTIDLYNWLLGRGDQPDFVILD
jgi:glycosyltransferase involved in cell wall biosynthesis